MKGRKKKNLPKQRNWIAVLAFRRKGEAHKNRDEDVRKGRSRKVKHKNRRKE